jgi:hypothetical protein
MQQLISGVVLLLSLAYLSDPIVIMIRIDIAMETNLSILFLYSGAHLSIEIPLYPQTILLRVNRRKYDNDVRPAGEQGVVMSG